MLLEQEPAISVVGEAADGLQAISMAETLQPDILLLDIQMPGLGGIEALLHIHKKSPRTRVLILSGFSNDEFMIQALQLGARGYLEKTLSHKDVAKAIRAIYNGEIWADRKVLTQVMENLYRKVHGVNAPFLETQETLTDRERDIVRWVIQGMTNKEIAARLGISDKTVKTHLSNIFSKLKINRRLELILYQIVERNN